MSTAVALALLALLGVRPPLVRAGGYAALVTDATPETVHEAFTGPPPPLALQWGLADTVTRTGTGARYEFSYLFDLRSVTMAVEAHHPTDAACDVELSVTEAGHPWATYRVTVDGRPGGAAVEVEWNSDRRFGLRRLPLWLVTRGYRDATLSAQGYEAVDRQTDLRIQPDSAP